MRLLVKLPLMWAGFDSIPHVVQESDRPCKMESVLENVERGNEDATYASLLSFNDQV